MIHVKQCYAHLLTLTQLFLLREHPYKQAKILSPENYLFFQKKVNLSPVEKTLTYPQSKQTKPLAPAPSSFSLPKHKEDSVGVQKEEFKVSLEKEKTAQVKHHPIEEPSLIAPLTLGNSFKKEAPSSKRISLEPLPQIPFFDIKDYWNIFLKVFPEVKLIATLPNDSKAKKLKNYWMSDPLTLPVIILSFNTDERSNNFLKNIAQAISLHLAPASVYSINDLEKQIDFKSLLNSNFLRLVIVSDYFSFSQSSLKNFYREDLSKKRHFLNHVPLLLLSDVSLYLKDPALKRILWKSICHEYGPA